MRLRFSRQAIADINDISDYLHGRSPAGARNVRDAIYRSFLVITAHPFSGRAVDRGLRKQGVARYPYNIYYRLNERSALIEVVTIPHAARGSSFRQ